MSRPTRALVFALFLSAAGRAEAQASAYVPLDDVAYGYVDALASRGLLPSLSGLERPYTRREINAAIDSARERVSSPVLLSWLDALAQASGKYAVAADSDSSSVHARFSGDAYVTAQSSGRRELMLSDRARTVKPGMTLRMVMEGGPIAVSIRGLIDNRLNVDPEFAGRKDRKIGGRMEDAYGGGQWKYGELTFGRLARNWGPSPLTGLLLGNYSYTFDQLYGKIGSKAIHISSVIARLDEMISASGPSVQRYLSVHRLALRHASWEVGASESFLYTGVGRSFEPSLSNPFNIFALSWRNERADGNLGMGLDGLWRTRRFGNFGWQLFLDDLQIDKCDTICHEPSSYGATVTLEGLPLRGDHRAFASYTRVSNLAYRTPNPAERYDVFGVGIGRGFSDYDETRIGADLAVFRAAPLRIYGAFRRQGEGDYRAPYPARAAYITTPGILSGVVTKVARIGISGVATYRAFETSADVGINHEANADHLVGRSRSEFAGRIKISWVPRLHADF